VAEKLEGKFDLVLSDIGLPDGTGLQLMKTLKQRWRLKVKALSRPQKGEACEETIAGTHEVRCACVSHDGRASPSLDMG